MACRDSSLTQVVASADGYVCVVLLVGMLKTQHEGEMDMTFLATGCEWRCLGEQERGVPHQPLLPSGAVALASEY